MHCGRENGVAGPVHAAARPQVDRGGHVPADYEPPQDVRNYLVCGGDRKGVVVDGAKDEIQVEYMKACPPNH